MTTVDPQVLRVKDSFLYTREITKPFGQLDPVIEWCKAECTSDWRWQVQDVSSDIRPGRYVFYFDSERDCCAFALKWS
jgi:hypothetical protein